eukprot:EC724932.1.p1 GENE.EC724932.1~~EC724932.1.p1  ORF type:complete len:135 (+),score=7.02 EC724932.1:114-518(+)
MEKYIAVPSKGDIRTACDGFPRTVSIMIDPSQTGLPGMSMGVESAPVGSQIPEHHHTDAEEILFFYQGSGKVKLGEQEFSFEGETSVIIPRNTRHAIINTGSVPLRLTWTYAPGGNEQGFRNHARWTPASASDL